MTFNRHQTVILTIGVCYLAVICKLFYIQIINYPRLAVKLTSQNVQVSTIDPASGQILDSFQNPLVTYQTVFYASVYKPDTKLPLDKLVSQFQSAKPDLVQSDVKKLTDFVANDRQKWLTLNSKFLVTEADQLKDPGITFSSKNEPVYPEGNLGSIFLKGNGLAKYYHRQLEGRAGFSWESRDAVGKTILTHPGWLVDAVNGTNISTDINRQAQYFSELTLKNGIDNFSADSGEILIMRPDTGTIIAMTAAKASPSSEATPSSTTWKNPIIADLFEPGSIVKPLVMAAALDSHSIAPDFVCQKCDQPLQIGQYFISNWDNSFHPHTDLKDIIKNSDNIGMSYIMAALGQTRFLDYFHRLGFDQKTGIDLPGETYPSLKKNWPEIDLATASFGQGFATTQVAMLTAFNTLANNGQRVNPHFSTNLKPVTTSVYNPDTVNFLKTVLKYSVENGAVAKFKPKSMEVCGKSGTSQVAIKGGYSDSTTVASYVGFSPCDHPKFSMIVTIHNPRSSPWGSSTAAPIWFKIAEELLTLL